MESPKPNEDHRQKDIADCKTIIASILRAMKTLSLYPEDHAHSRGAMQKLESDLGSFLSNYEKVVFRVKKNQLLFGDEVVHKTTESKGNLVFALFRDGIYNFSFLRGIDIEEIKKLLKILSKYQTLPREPEGDIVTALWEAQLPHVRYEAIDDIVESDTEGNAPLSQKLKDTREHLLSAQTPKSQPRPKESNEGANSLEELEHEVDDLPGVDLDAIQLTNEETKSIKAIVQQEENRDATLDILNMLTDILNEEKDEEFLDTVLEYMKEELQAALAQKQTDISFKILRRLHEIILAFKDTNPSKLALLKKFFIKVSSPSYLAVLKDVLPTLNTSERKALEKVLLLLPPSVIGTLCAMMQEVSAPPARKVLSDVVVFFASRRFETFENVLNTADKELFPLLVSLLGRIKHEKTRPVLIKMTHHQSGEVRKKALKALMKNGLWVPEELLFLMDDKSVAVRHLLMRYLRSHRSEALESLLLDYMCKFTTRGRDHEKITDCFRILGRCGTGLSIPFLEDNLMKGRWISRFCYSVRRQGAAIALKEIGTEKALEVLKLASKSHFPGIRRAAQEVMSVSKK